jgi:hypothetical protein
MLSFCRYLLYLYPPSHRLEYGEEMVAVLCERQAESWNSGVVARWAFWAREIAGLLHGALREHVRAMTGLHPWVVFPLRRFSMRSEFRFPKATGWLMLVILAAIVMAIEKAKAIQASLPDTHPYVGPIQPAQFALISTFALLFVAGCVIGAVGWAVLFALRRSGVQRLSQLHPSGDRSSGGKLSV